MVSLAGGTLVVALGGCGARGATVSPEPAPLASAAPLQPHSSCEGDEIMPMVEVGLHPRRRAPISSCSGVPGPSIEQARAERRVVELVNAQRARGAWCGDRWFPPVAPLRSEPRLQCAAQAHSYDMATHGYFGHDDLQGRSPFERIAATGYPRGSSAENISAGQGSAAEVVTGWMESPGHCANIMSARHTEIGVGHAMAADLYGHYWTQTFGAR